MAKYRVTARARADLRRIYKHGLYKYGKNKADQYYDRLIERFAEIEQNPYLYQSADHISSDYRRSVCGVDSIFYRVIDDTVEIISILGRQDINEVL